MVQDYDVYVLINVLCTRVNSLYRYETIGAPTAEVEDCVASTAQPHNDREYVARDAIRD